MKTANLDLNFQIASIEAVQSYISDIISLEQQSGLPIIWTKDNILKDLNLKWTLSQLAFVEEKLVGFAFVSKKTESSCHLHRIIIDSAYRNSKYKLGSKLLENLKSTLCKNYNFLTLCVSKDNAAAIAFYQKHKFEHIWNIESDLLLLSSLTHNNI